MADVVSRKISRTCDECRIRKVRCTRSNDEGQLHCRNCVARNAQCHFSFIKRPRKRKITPEDGSFVAACGSVTPSTTSHIPDSQNSQSNQNEPHASEVSHNDGSNLSLASNNKPNRRQSLTQLYIDLVLADPRTSTAHKNEPSSTNLTEFFGHSSNVSFFSSSRVRSLNSRLGHTKLNQLMQRIDSVLSVKLNKNPGQMARLYTLRQSDRVPPSITRPLTTSYIQSYFEQVHPIYPFLNRQTFEQRAFESMSQHSETEDQAWTALYHTVLAIGCQYNDGGSFNPGYGPAWKLFEIALSYFPDIMMMKGSLIAVQALTAMAIFSLSTSAYQFESLLVTEAARLGQSMGYNKTTSSILSSNENERHRVFWVIYCLEKISCFTTGRTSIIMDSDVGCPVPNIPESIFGDYDWFLSFARYSRLVSRICSSLFSVSSGEHTASAYHSSIYQLNDELEAWRVSIPIQYRPLEHLSGRGLSGMLGICVAVNTQYMYFSALLTLLRVSLHVGVGDQSIVPDQQEAKKQFMETACLILDSTKHVEVAAYTPLWLMAFLPISALFILFDFVVHNPTHPEANNSLALLDVASGHFGRIEYASRGALPGSLVSEFAHIAREYVRDVQRQILQSSRHNEDSNTLSSNLDQTSPSLQQTKLTITNESSTPSNQDLQQNSQHEVRSQIAHDSQPSNPGPMQAMGFPAIIPTPIPLTSPPQQQNRMLASQLSATYPTAIPHNQAVGTEHGARTETIFFPLVDDPTYFVPGDEEIQQLLGIDVMNLFDLAGSSATGLDRR